jgi:hypothetical protein
MEDSQKHFMNALNLTQETESFHGSDPEETFDIPPLHEDFADLDHRLGIEKTSNV